MQEHYDDEPRPRPGRRIDYDAAMAQMVEDNNNTTLEEHYAAEDAAAAFLGQSVVREIAGAGEHSAVLVEDREAFDSMVKASRDEATRAAATDAAQATGQATAQEAATATAAATAAPPQPAAESAPAEQAAAAAEKSKSEFDKPTSVESSLANIQLTGKRQQRFVILGDPEIERRFYDALAEKGRLHYQGGVPIIGVSRKEAIQLLQEVAEKVPGATARHAVNLDINRDGHGLTGAATAGLANALGRRHEIDVMVVGNAVTIGNKMEELGKVLQQMKQQEFFTADSTLPVTGQRLEFAEGGPVRLKGEVKLDELLASAKDAVGAYKRQEMEKDQARKAFRNAAEDRKLADAKGGDLGAADGARPGEVNKLARELSATLTEAMANPVRLSERNEHNQSLAVSVLVQSSVFLDPAKAELGTLPAADRQAMLANLSALVAKADDKEFGALSKSETAKLQTLKEKLPVWHTEEAARDPQFQANAKATLEGLVKSDILTEAQAARATEGIAKAIAPMDTSRNAEAPAPSAPVATQSEATVAQPEAVKAAPEAASAPEVKVAAPESAKEGTQAPSAVQAVASTESAHAAPTADASAAKPAPAPEAAVAAERATPAPAVAEPAAPAQEAFRDRVATLLANGPAALTSEQVSGVLAELDARRTQPLSALDAGTGSKPSTTLVRLENILQEASSGRFGPALATEAKDLRGAMNAWHQQDRTRLGVPPKDAPKDIAELPLKELQAAADHAKASATERAPAAAPLDTTRIAQRVGMASNINTLHELMANPAGSFTKRDKTWNAVNVQRAARAVAALDAGAIAKLEPGQRTTLAAYATWMADNANAGKLPGFTSEEGKQLAAQVTRNAEALIGHAEGALPASTVREMGKAERLVDAMAQREGQLSLGLEGSREAPRSGPAATFNANNLAKDLVHAVYHKPELDEAYVKYLLKNAEQLTPESIKSLDSDMKARTTTALSFLAGAVRDGAMGEFDTLSPGVRRNVMGASRAAEALESGLRSEPGMTTALIKASMDLPGRDAPAGEKANDGAHSKASAPENARSAHKELER